jgi:hypothetical protein
MQNGCGQYVLLTLVLSVKLTTHHSAIFLWQRMTLFSMSIGW